MSNYHIFWVLAPFSTIILFWLDRKEIQEGEK